MTGVEALGSRALAGRQGPGVADKAAAFDQLGLQVTPENVLTFYKAIAQEATRLNQVIQEFQQANFGGMPLLGGDPISRDMKDGYDKTTRQLLEKCQADVNDLRDVADGLHEAARAYGNSEEKIKESFDPSTYQVPATSPSIAELPANIRGLADPTATQPPPAGSIGDLLGRGAR